VLFTRPAAHRGPPFLECPVSTSLSVKKMMSLDADFLLDSVVPRLMQQRTPAFSGLVELRMEGDHPSVTTLDFATGEVSEAAAAAPPALLLSLPAKDVEAVLGGKSKTAGVLERVTLRTGGGVRVLRELSLLLRPSDRAVPTGGSRELGSDEQARRYVLRGSSGVRLKANRPAGPGAAAPRAAPAKMLAPSGKAPATDPVAFAMHNLATWLDELCTLAETAMAGRGDDQSNVQFDHAALAILTESGNISLGRAESD